MKLFGYSLKCALNFILSSVKVLGDKYGNAVSLKFIFNTYHLMYLCCGNIND